MGIIIGQNMCCQCAEELKGCKPYGMSIMPKPLGDLAQCVELMVWGWELKMATGRSNLDVVAASGCQLICFTETNVEESIKATG